MDQTQKLLQLIIFTFITISPYVSSAVPHHLRALVAPITKDTLTSLYTLTLNNNQSFVLDITGNLLWSECPQNHPLISCKSHKCTMAHSFQSPLCPPIITVNKRPCTCVATPINTVTQTCAFGDLTYTNLTISRTDGRTPITPITVPNIVSSCTPKTLLRSLPALTSGMAGLARSRIALPTQLASSLSVERSFAICLPSSSTAHGVAFFGSGPFFLQPPPGLEITSILSYAPLLRNQMNYDYYIDVKAVAINGEMVRFLARVLMFDSLGHGGVKLSTVVPYTTLMSHIYLPFLKAFAWATRDIPRAPKVHPFDLCLNTSRLGSTRVGLPVPQIDVMLTNGKNWTFFGSNSMKQVSDDVACLAVVDGGTKAEQAAVIGSFQMEDNFLLFDLAKQRIGFSSTLLFFRTTCGNFNFQSGV
ncbi:chitinase CLP-like [Magnolia sinica]|uniref:chitinase CLP-like n=1 Tax=Magnolia sinica TaxID=86752 RepID=UPI00265A8D19|nr:chitinase CLP-like [Magnolia sinica]